MPHEYPSCTIRYLPPHMQAAAVRNALALNPVNRPLLAGVLDLLHRHVLGLIGDAEAPVIPQPDLLAVMTSKYWGGGGVKLTVGFLDTTDAALKARLLAHMNSWQQYANVTFVESNTDPQVRIARKPGDGYWSYLGTDILSIPHGQPTMNLDSFTMNTPESEYRRVVRHETGHCLVGDTMIDGPRDLEKYPLGIPIKDLVGQQPWVYAWKDGQAVVRKASRVWLSKKNVETVRVRLRAGRGVSVRKFLPPLELVGTADHPVLLADGKTWKNLGDLKPGDRLCSLYRSKNGPRSRVFWTGLPERVREHVFVAEQVYGERPPDHDCHHKNERKLDQRPENLEWKPEHLHHRDHSIGRKDKPGTRAKRVAASTGRRHTEAARAKMSQAQLNRPPISEETRARISAGAKGRTQSPEQLEKKAAAMRRFYDAGNRSGMFGKTASEETRRKRSESMKATLAKKKAVANHTVLSVEPAGRQDVYDMTVPDAESFVANGVVVHNCLGCPHEHLRRELVARLDRNKTIAYFQRQYGWSPQTTTQQVLTPIDEASLLGTPHADAQSIMCYQLPGSITTDGQPIVGGTDIDAVDQDFIAKVYPPLVVPPPPPPPPPTGGLATVQGLDGGGGVLWKASVK